MRDQLIAPTDGKNRLVTVLFADMSSSVATTAGMAPDETAELVNQLLKAMVDAFTRYEGRAVLTASLATAHWRSSAPHTLTRTILSGRDSYPLLLNSFAPIRYDSYRSPECLTVEILCDRCPSERKYLRAHCKFLESSAPRRRKRTLTAKA